MIPSNDLLRPDNQEARGLDKFGFAHLSLPFPMSTNRLYRAVKGRSILSEQYRAWKAEAAQMLMLQRAPRIAGPVSITVSLRAPDKRARDGDNLLKSTFDALKSYGVIEDDSNRIIRRFSVEWSSIGDPCVVSISRAA